MAVNLEQRDEWFVLAGVKLARGAKDALFARAFSHAQGDRLVTMLRGDSVTGQAVFSNIKEGANAELSVWVADKIGLDGREFLRSVFAVAFDQYKLRRLSAFTRASNSAAHKALTRLGFRYETTLERWFGNESGVSYRMFPEQCRWLTGVQHHESQVSGA